MWFFININFWVIFRSLDVEIKKSTLIFSVYQWPENAFENVSADFRGYKNTLRFSTLCKFYLLFWPSPLFDVYLNFSHRENCFVSEPITPIIAIWRSYECSNKFNLLKKQTTCWKCMHSWEFIGVDDLGLEKFFSI